LHGQAYDGPSALHPSAVIARQRSASQRSVAHAVVHATVDREPPLHAVDQSMNQFLIFHFRQPLSEIRIHIADEKFTT
jgi:hypothetical protein